MKHTPGPWEYSLIEHGSAKGHYRVIGDGGELAVVTVGNDPSFDDITGREQGENDARLIAAAPDLLAIAEEIWEIVGQSIIMSPTQEQRLRAAISKATGEEKEIENPI